MYLCADPERAMFFDAVVTALGENTKLVLLATNYIVSDLAGIYAKRGNEGYAALNPKAFARLIRLISTGDLSSRGAKDTLRILVEHGGDPEAIAKEHGLTQMRDTETLQRIVEGVLVKEVKAVNEYRAGKETALQYLLGRSIKATNGAGDPSILRDLILKEINRIG